MRVSSLWFLLAPLAALGCMQHASSVTRIADGREVTGRYISPEAYADYMKGAYHEARNEFQRARESYERALAHDPKGPEIRTRLLSIACRLESGASVADFEALLRRFPAYAPAWRESARCRWLKGDSRRALAEALRAAALSPDVREGSELVIALYEENGNGAASQRWRNGWRLAHSEPWEKGNGKPRKGAIRRALEGGDLEEARKLARAARMTGGELAALAAERGHPRAATQQAELVLGAEPEDADAWIARAAAADLERDPEALRHALSSPPSGASPLNPASARLLGDLIERLVGRSAAELWRHAAQGEVEEGLSGAPVGGEPVP